MKGFGGVMDFSAFEALDFNAESQKEALEQGVVARESFYTQLGEMSLEHHANELAKEEEKIRATGERELEQLRNSRAYKFMSDKKKLEEEKKITDATNKELKENFNKRGYESWDEAEKFLRDSTTLWWFKNTIMVFIKK